MIDKNLDLKSVNHLAENTNIVPVDEDCDWECIPDNHHMFCHKYDIQWKEGDLMTNKKCVETKYCQSDELILANAAIFKLQARVQELTEDNQRLMDIVRVHGTWEKTILNIYFVIGWLTGSIWAANIVNIASFLILIFTNRIEFLWLCISLTVINIIVMLMRKDLQKSVDKKL